MPVLFFLWNLYTYCVSIISKISYKKRSILHEMTWHSIRIIFRTIYIYMMFTINTKEEGSVLSLNVIYSLYTVISLEMKWFNRIIIKWMTMYVWSAKKKQTNEHIIYTIHKWNVHIIIVFIYSKFSFYI